MLESVAPKIFVPVILTHSGAGCHYPTAIGHYTTAMLADRNDPTYPLNRAAAHLRLGKYVSTGTRGKQTIC
jgi:hypothetical protein